MTPIEFNALFDGVTRNAFRFEGLPVYAVDDEDPDLVAWRTGRPQAERSVRTSPWLARIAQQTVVEGISWSRVRHATSPPSWYLRWEVNGYVESQAAGEQILLTGDRSMWDGPDFWLFDAGSPGVHGVLQHYDPQGRPAGYEPVADEDRLTALDAAAQRLMAVSTPLNVWLVEHAAELRGIGVGD